MRLTERLLARRRGGPAPRPRWRAALALLALTGSLAHAGAHAQGPAPAATQPPAGTQAKPPASGKAVRPSAQPKASPNGLAWSELSARQQEALAPLAGHWGQLHPAQQRKWIALSGNFAKMSADERSALHSRMTVWAALSPQERSRARLNYAEVKRLAPADERKAKWEAYQALPPEERQKLAEQGAGAPKGAAVPVRPVPQRMLAPVPPLDHTIQRTPRIQLAPPESQVSTPAQSAPIVQK